MGARPWSPQYYRHSPGATSTSLNSKMTLLETTKLMDARCFRQLESCYLSVYYVNYHGKNPKSSNCMSRVADDLLRSMY